MRQLHNIRSYLVVVVSIFFACMAPPMSWALQLNTADGLKAPVSLSGSMSILYDRTGGLKIEDVASGRADMTFEAIPSMLTAGYQKGAVWVRFSLSAPMASDQWLLQIERPLIENVTLYVRDEQGHFAILSPGRLHLRNKDGADAYPVVFPISVPAIPTDYYLRLQSSTSITSSLNVWQRDGYEDYRRIDDWVIGIVIGAICAMLFANLLYYSWLRDSIYPIYASFLLISGLITTFHMGYSSEVLYFLDPQNIRYSWGIIVCLYSITMMLFLEGLFEFRRHVIWACRISQTVVLLNGVALAFSLAGHYSDVGFFVSRLQLSSLIFVALFALYLLIVQRQYKYFLSSIAFLSVICVLSVMQLQYTGANPLQIDGSLARFLAAGTLIHLVLLSAAVAKRAQLAERSLNEEKDRALATARSTERQLSIKVRERTAELVERNASLRAEMDRRHLLEIRLRQSLDTVNNALAQQRDFVALVSHEFRAPLSVIAGAADNLAHFPAEGTEHVVSRTARIRQAVRRMSMLIENVLAGDQLDAGQAPQSSLGFFDLNDVLRLAKASLDDDAAGRLSFIPGDRAVVRGDINLLEILLQNLIQNALKYSSHTSRVTVELSTDQGMAFITVIDHGIGVAPDDRDFIFLKYYRAAGQRVKGSGLGLYISREIARHHGGDLVLVASDGKGSVFCLSLPIEEREPNNPRSSYVRSQAMAESPGSPAGRV